MVNEMKIFNINGVVVSEECKIEFGVNVKRIGSKSWVRYENYMEAVNVLEFFEKGGLIEDLRYDCKKGFCKLVERYDIKNKKVVII